MLVSMSQIVVRPVLPEDVEGFFDVRSLTYNDGNPIPDDRKTFSVTKPFVAVLDGEVSGGFVYLDLTCTRGAAVLDCAGVAAVAVYPHRRRSGVGSAMMAWLPGYLREIGVPIASLYAFRETFYRKFGYEVGGRRLKITCPTHRIPKTQSSLPIRRLKPTDWPELDSCYRAFAHARSGLSLRDEILWKRVLGENRELTIYAAGNPVEAYAVVSHSTAFWTTDHVSDVAWSSMEGYDALMEIFAGLAMNKTALSWFEPSDSPIYTKYMDQGIEAKIDRPIMYRICDVPKALSLLKPDDSGEFTIRVFDETVPENVGPWRVTFAPGSVTVEKSESADLEIDIRPFAQAFLGEPSLLDLARLGIVKVHRASALTEAAKLMPALPVICNDFF